MSRGHLIFPATRVAGVNRLTFGDRTRPNPPVKRETRYLPFADAIGKVHEDSPGAYGFRRVQATLGSRRDTVVNHTLIPRVLAGLGLSGLPRKKTQKRNLMGVQTSSGLVSRDFTVTGPSQLWATDLTEHNTRDITVYACVVFAVVSHKAVGWAVD